jgi:hypothetical protein
LTDTKFNNESEWKDGVKINEVNSLVDLDEKTSAYLVKLTNSEDKYAEYIMINADKNYVPVIEFSYTLQSIPEIINEQARTQKSKDSVKIKSKNKFYYLKNYEYMVDVENDNGETFTYSSIDNNFIDKNEKIKNKSETTKDLKKYESDWSNLLAGYTNPPTFGSNIIITNPGQYETGQTSYGEKDVSGYNQYYKKALELYNNSNYQHCGPTAAVNFCLYWSRNNSKYNKLYDNNNWYTAFNTLGAYMTFIPYVGTSWTSVGAGIQGYFADKSLLCWQAPDSSVSVYDVTQEIGAGRPFIVFVKDHYVYKTHIMLGLGYKEWKYSNGYSSVYIRVVDGLSNYANRYINKDIGNKGFGIVKMSPQ